MSSAQPTMIPKPIRFFLIKIIPAFFATLILWHHFYFSDYYHMFIAAVLDGLVPLFDRSDVVRGVMYNGGAFVFQVGQSGRSGVLDFTARTFTNNMPLLIALLSASPIRPYARTYFLNVLGALAAMAAIHVITTAGAMQLFLMVNPDSPSTIDYGSAAVWMVRTYEAFYPRYGEFLFVLLLWCPYVIWYLVQSQRAPAVSSRR